MRVLIVEDEIKAARFLQKGLQENGFSAEIFHDGEEGLLAALGSKFDLMIIDRMLPTLDGLSLMRTVRKTNKEVPIIILTARDAVYDRISGIESGANIYLVKPFSFTEVLAYARSLTQRTIVQSEGKLRIADLELDLHRRRIQRQNRIIELTSKEFALLSLLVRRKQQILSRTVIAEEVWGLNYDPGTNVVDVHIRRLRVKIDDQFEKKLIHTIRGSGYMLDDSGN